MSLQATIEHRLKAHFHPSILQVDNESHQHNVPPDSETHFRVVMASDEFEGKQRIQRHQAVYALLSQEMETTIHALTLHLYTPSEWQAKASGAPQSPPCLGGGAAGARGPA